MNLLKNTVPPPPGAGWVGRMCVPAPSAAVGGGQVGFCIPPQAALHFMLPFSSQCSSKFRSGARHISRGKTLPHIHRLIAGVMLLTDSGLPFLRCFCSLVTLCFTISNHFQPESGHCRIPAFCVYIS